MLDDAPDSMVGGFHKVKSTKSTKGGKRVFAGGCTRRPNVPVNGKIQCSLDRYIFRSTKRIEMKIIL